MQRTIFGVLVLLLVTSCTKDKQPAGTASLIIINTVVGSAPLKTNFSGTGTIRYNTANQVSYGQFSTSNNRYSPGSGTIPLSLYQYPDTLPKSAPMFNLTLELPVASVNTLFLTGTVNQPESFLIKDEIPFYPPGDSAMGLRFVNLSPGSDPVSVNLISKANGSETAGLSFKGITAFQKYAVKRALSDYVFEFRNANTGAFIASYTTAGISNNGQPLPNSWLYRNFTLALIGSPQGAGAAAQRILLISHAPQ